MSLGLQSFLRFVRSDLTRIYYCCHVRTNFVHRVLGNPTLTHSQKRHVHDGHEVSQDFTSPQHHFDWDYLTDPRNTKEIEDNIKNRKGVGNIKKLQKLHRCLQSFEETDDLDNFISESPKQTEPSNFLQDKASDIAEIKRQLIELAAEIPNTSHPASPVGDDSQNNIIAIHGEKRDFAFPPKTLVRLGEKLKMLRTKNTLATTGDKGYYFLGDLALLEQALIQYTVDKLAQKGFELLCVPDLVHPEVIKGCGFKVSGQRTQVYKLSPAHYPPVCLAGTGEMPLAGFFMNKTIDLGDLPAKVMTVSKCFRAEVSEIEQESGIYRVHQFTKVEMFGLCEEGKNSELMEEFVNIQTDLFSELGLHFRVMDMATQELGAPAHRKYDMEAWMPALGFWGEISSTSDCTDYQSRRLNMTYLDSERRRRMCYTVNGTACAVPRMIMAILETNQNANCTIPLPAALHPYMSGCSKLIPYRTASPHFIKYNKRNSEKS